MEIIELSYVISYWKSKFTKNVMKSERNKTDLILILTNFDSIKCKKKKWNPTLDSLFKTAKLHVVSSANENRLEYLTCIWDSIYRNQVIKRDSIWAMGDLEITLVKPRNPMLVKKYYRIEFRCCGLLLWKVFCFFLVKYLTI